MGGGLKPPKMASEPAWRAIELARRASGPAGRPGAISELSEKALDHVQGSWSHSEEPRSQVGGPQNQLGGQGDTKRENAVFLVCGGTIGHRPSPIASQKKPFCSLLNNCLNN